MQWSAGVDQSTDENLTTGDYGSNQMDHRRAPPNHQHAQPHFGNGGFHNAANAYGNPQGMPPVLPSQGAPFGQDAPHNSFRMGEFQQGYPPGQHMPGVRPGGGFQQFGQAMPVQPFGPAPGQLVVPAQPFNMPGDGPMQPMMMPYPTASGGMGGPWNALPGAHGAHGAQPVDVHTDPTMFAGMGMGNMIQYQYYPNYMPNVSGQAVYMPVNTEEPASTIVASKSEISANGQPQSTKDAGDEMVERLMGKIHIGSESVTATSSAKDVPATGSPHPPASLASRTFTAAPSGMQLPLNSTVPPANVYNQPHLPPFQPADSQDPNTTCGHLGSAVSFPMHSFMPGVPGMQHPPALTGPSHLGMMHHGLHGPPQDPSVPQPISEGERGMYGASAAPGQPHMLHFQHGGNIMYPILQPNPGFAGMHPHMHALPRPPQAPRPPSHATSASSFAPISPPMPVPPHNMQQYHPHVSATLDMGARGAVESQSGPEMDPGMQGEPHSGPALSATHPQAPTHGLHGRSGQLDAQQPTPAPPPPIQPAPMLEPAVVPQSASAPSPAPRPPPGPPPGLEGPPRPLRSTSSGGPAHTLPAAPPGLQMGAGRAPPVAGSGVRGVSMSPAPLDDPVTTLLPPQSANPGWTSGAASLPSPGAPTGGALRNGKFLNISELFHGGANSAVPTEAAVYSHPNGHDPQIKNDAVAGEVTDEPVEHAGGEESGEKVLDEARPPPGPPTMLKVEPPPPGQLQLSGLRVNSTKARPIGALPRAGLPRIDAAAADLAAQLAPSAQEQAEVRSAFSEVERVLLQLRPDASVHLYGSAASGLYLRANRDLDVTLLVSSDQPLDRDGQAAVLVELAEGLTAKGMLEVTVREASRVPVAKFQLPDSAIDVDITINNLLPLRNTELLRTYAAIDTRLRDFIYIIKHWAKQRQIADAYKSTLSPYAWVLMAVFVAQRAGLVPVLQREEPLDVDCEVEAGGKPWRCAYSLDVDRFAEAAKACDISVGGLLTMFFDYYATRFDFNEEVVCPARGHTIIKAELDWTRRINNEKHLCCIQDPLLLAHDLGRTVTKDMRRYIQRELGRACDIVYSELDPLRSLCQPAQGSGGDRGGGGGPRGGRGYGRMDRGHDRPWPSGRGGRGAGPDRRGYGRGGEPRPGGHGGPAGRGPRLPAVPLQPRPPSHPPPDPRQAAYPPQ